MRGTNEMQTAKTRAVDPKRYFESVDDRRAAVAELERLGADAVIVSTEGPVDEQVRKIVTPSRSRSPRLADP